MLDQLILIIGGVVANFIDNFGVFGVGVLMALESANVPIPSEVILTYGGFLASKGVLNFHLVAIAGAVGCIVGGSISYWLGYIMGRPFLMKHGKWFLISKKNLVWSEKFLEKYGEATYFISRMLPVVRTFIAFPIGIAKGSFWRFNFYSFWGSLIWSYLLTWIGVKLGDNWTEIKPIWDKFSYAVIFFIIVGIIWHVLRVFNEKEK